MLRLFDCFRYPSLCGSLRFLLCFGPGRGEPRELSTLHAIHMVGARLVPPRASLPGALTGGVVDHGERLGRLRAARSTCPIQRLVFEVLHLH